MTVRPSIWTGNTYGTTTPGSPAHWRQAFADALHAMGVDEAKGILGADDPWMILGVSPSTAPTSIKRIFRALCLKHHPDKNPGDPEANERFRRILAAYKLVEKGFADA